jgi:uncharacterized protein (DUF1015 family)
MAEINPFRGYRFDPSVAGEMSRVIAPPYDVIDADLRDILFRLSAYNISRVTRADRIENSPTGNPYSAAGDLWAEWRRQGVVKQDAEPALYVYEQVFEVHGRRLSRTALTAALKLEEPGGGVLPHESTLAGPRADRLELMRATRTQFGQVFGLYADPSGAVNGMLGEVKKRRPLVQASDRQDLLHRLWAETDPALIGRLQNEMREKEILIADGHHRYETSLAYRKEHPELASANLRMMSLVNMADSGLVILPIHRLVKNVQGFKPQAFLSELRRAFEIKMYPGDIAAVRGAVLDAVREQQGQGRHAFGLYMGDGAHRVIILRSDSLMDAGDGHSEAWRRLDVPILHRLILEKIMGITAERVQGEANIEYIQDFPHALDTAADRVRAGECQALFLLNPTRVEEVQAVVRNRERMPQKSTFFYPKMYTGMVFYCMDG